MDWEICIIVTAIGNHEEEIGKGKSQSHALILADKSDAHRTRQSSSDGALAFMTGQSGNTDSKLYVDKTQQIISLEIVFDQEVCQIMDFFEIYLTRMDMCKEASAVLGCRFRLLINELEFLGQLSIG